MIAPRKQAGVALLTAVMVVAMATTLTAGLMVSQNLSVHRAANMRSLDAAWWYLIGLEEWAGTILQRDLQDSQVDSLDELWAQRIDFLPVDEGVLAGQIVDLGSRFNLNSLGLPGDQVAQDQFRRLLLALPELRNKGVEDLGTVIADWNDADSEPRFPGGAEDDRYLSLDPPRRAANQPLVSVSELRLMPGVDAEVYAALEPHVAALPLSVGSVSINVNTATPIVLQSLVADMTPGDLEALLQTREDTPFESAEAFRAHPAMAGRETAVPIDAKSTVFLAQGTADIDGVRLQLVSVIQRGVDGKSRTLWRSRAPL